MSVPEMVVTMTFAEALEVVLAGGRITKLDWEDQQFWCELVNGQLHLHKPDGINYPLIVSEGDLRGADWVDWWVWRNSP